MGFKNKKQPQGSQGKGKGPAKSTSMMHKYAGGTNSLAFQMKKEKKEKQRNMKSAALREYAKLCKKEGIESERVNLGPRVEKSEEAKRADWEEKKKNKKALKSQPFAKEQQQAEVAAAEKREGQKARLSREEEIAQKLKARKEKTRDRMKKTKKGQPLMNDTVKRLLSSIQKKQ
jgi:hypothetical protein